MSIIRFKEDGSQWYNYFHIRYDQTKGYYFSFNGKVKNAFPGEYWHSSQHSHMRRWICEDNRWRIRLDEEFEQEVLGGK